MVIGFDIYALLVSYVAGNVFIALLLVALILLIIGIFGRMAIQSILVVLVFFLCVSLIGLYGSLAALPVFLGCTYYAISGILNFINNMR